MYPIGSGHLRRGVVQVNPLTAAQLGLEPGDSVVLNQNGAIWPFLAESFVGIEPGQAGLNRTEMTVMGIRYGTPLVAHRVPHPAALLHDWPAQRGRHDWLVPMELP